MSVLHQIAHFQNRRDEAPNQILAEDLIRYGDSVGIHQIAESLWNLDPAIQSDCLKVLYEIGYRKPDLISGYAPDFIKLLRNRNNRLVWGGMIALSTVASLCPGEIYTHRAEILDVMRSGSVITVDNAVKALAAAAAQDETYRQDLLLCLLEHLQTCRSKDIPHHAESILPAVDTVHAASFIQILQARLSELTAFQAARVRKVIQGTEKQPG